MTFRRVLTCIAGLLLSACFALAELDVAPHIELVSSNGHFRVHMPVANPDEQGGGALRINSGSELLLTINLSVKGKPLSGPFGVSAKIVSNGWHFIALQLTNGLSGRWSFRRNILLVEPDLFVVSDEVRASEPLAAEYALAGVHTPQADARTGNVSVESTMAGVTARWLLDERQIFGDWLSDKSNTTGAQLRLSTKSGVTNFHAVIVLVPHLSGRKRALGFKLLESSTAIGARIHRDGLPTLVAFRTDCNADEADLTGLKFRGAIAVDVFDPSPTKRRPTRRQK